MKVFLGADHGGFELKNVLREHLHHRGFDVHDCGPMSLDKDDDYPPFAYQVAADVLGNDGSFGILICRSGQGMAMAANKVRGIRAALAWTPAVARASREHNDANVLVLPSDYVDTDTALAITDDWLTENYSTDERHRRRVKQIEELYG